MKYTLTLITTLILLLPLAACSKGKGQTTNPAAGYNILTRTDIPYLWLFPAAFTGEVRDHQPEKDIYLWTFFSEQVPFEGAMWVRPYLDARQSLTVVDRDFIRLEVDSLAGKLERNASFLARLDRGTFSIDLIESRSGRDRLNAPVEIRVFDLVLDPNDEQKPSFILDWAARQLGGNAVISDRNEKSGTFRIAFAMTPLVNQFGEPYLDQFGTPYAAYAVWVAVPNRLPGTGLFERLALDFADAFPIATRFSTIAVTTESLSRPAQNRSIAVIATFDRGSILQAERNRIIEDFKTAIDRSLLAGIELRVAIARSCEAKLVKAVGADDFVLSSSQGFLEEIESRYNQIFADDDLDCLANMAQRTAIKVARASGSAWEEADERWFFWLTSRPDVANVGLDNLLFNVGVNEYSAALHAEKASYYAVGAADRLCNDTDKSTVAEEPLVGNDFRAKIDGIGGQWFEYCDEWDETLGTAWAARASINADLSLSRTPLPGSLELFSRGVSLAANSDFGYFEDRSEGVLIPGETVEFGPDDVWTVTYITFIDPDPDF